MGVLFTVIVCACIIYISKSISEESITDEIFVNTMI